MNDPTSKIESSDQDDVSGERTFEEHDCLAFYGWKSKWEDFENAARNLTISGRENNRVKNRRGN